MTNWELMHKDKRECRDLLVMLYKHPAFQEMNLVKWFDEEDIHAYHFNGTEANYVADIVDGEEVLHRCVVLKDSITGDKRIVDLEDKEHVILINERQLRLL